MSLFLVSLTTLLCFSYARNQGKYVNRCPLTKSEWKERSNHYNCSVTMVTERINYHCLKTTNDSFYESCFSRKAISFEDGCAEFDLEGGILRIKVNRCNYSSGCPGENFTDDITVYRSDESYKLMKIDTTQGLSSWKTALIFVGTAVVFAIIFGLICLVLLQCQRIKRYKYEMERSTYMSSVPYNTHVTHIYHQDTDVYDYVDDTDMIDDDKNTPESNELRQKRDIDYESPSESYVEPNRPDIESMERNEIFDINTQMKNAPLSCNIINQDTYLEPKIGLLTDTCRIRRGYVDVIESDRSMPLQDQRVCVKLSRLVSNDSYVEPSIGLDPSCQEESSVKEESFSVLSNTNITENEIAQKVDFRSDELNLQDLNSDVHYDDARSCINTSYMDSSYPRETDINISDKEDTLQTESTLNISVRTRGNVVISHEPVETNS